MPTNLQYGFTRLKFFLARYYAPKAKAWLFILRPQFLPLNGILYAISLVAVRSLGVSIHLNTAFWGHFLIYTLQVAAVLVSELTDIEGDRLNKNRNFFSGGSGVLRLGNASWTVDRCLDGSLDEFRISSVVRSTGWIQTSYSNQNAAAGSFYIPSGEEMH